MTPNKKILFVGSFKDKAPDGSVGGQMFACRTLVHSDLAQKIDFILIDTTAESVPAPPIYKRVPSAIKRVLRVIKHLTINKIDTVLIFSSSGLSLKEKGLMVFISRLYGVRVIFAPRSGLIIEEVKKSAFDRFFLQRVIRSANIVLCQGSSWKNFYQQFDEHKPDKFHVVLNWIDTQKYKPVHEARSNKVMSSGPLKILYLGWLESYKGIMDLWSVFNRLIEEGYDVEANVYGAGRLKDEITEQVNERGLGDKFKLLGWADEATKIEALKATDIFVLPSYAEGIPNALIEAMASGVPCVSSSVGGVPDLISDTTNGFIFDPGDVGSFYNNIVQLYNNETLRQSMGERAHAFAEDRCSIKFAVKYFESIL